MEKRGNPTPKKTESKTEAKLTEQCFECPVTAIPCVFMDLQQSLWY
jgi:hypothetical protein